MNNETETTIPAYAVESSLPRRSGRPSSLEALGITLDQLVAVYDKHHSESRAALELGITKRTLRKWLHVASVWPKGGRAVRGIGVTYRPSKLYYWIIAQNGVIPRSVREIAAQSGMKEVTVRKFLSRRKHAALAYIESLGQLRELEKVQLVSIKGQRLVTNQIATVHPTIDSYDLSITLKIVTRAAVSVTCKLSFAEYCRLFPESTDEGVLDQVAKYLTKPSGHREASPS